MYRHRVDFPGKYPVCGEEIKNTSMGGGALAPKSVNISHYISSYHKWFEPIRKFDHIIFGLVYRCTVTSGPAGSLAGCSRRYEVVSRSAIIGKKNLSLPVFPATLSRLSGAGHLHVPPSSGLLLLSLPVTYTLNFLLFCFLLIQLLYKID